MIGIPNRDPFLSDTKLGETVCEFRSTFKHLALTDSKEEGWVCLF